MKKVILMAVFLAGALVSCKKDSELPYADQLAQDKAAIDNYIISHGISAAKDSSGFRFKINSVGNGATPVNQSTRIYVRQTIYNLDDKVLQYDTAGNYYLLSTFFEAEQTVIKKLPKGSSFTIYLPSGLALGHASTATIPPNTPLIIDVLMLDDDAQLAYDETILDTYLDTVTNVITDTSGLRYKILAPGGASHPAGTSFVVIDFVINFIDPPGKLGKIISSGQSAQVTLADVNIEGLTIGLQKIGVGGHILLYMPSKLAYGYVGNYFLTPPVPSKSVVVFDVKLLSF